MLTFSTLSVWCAFSCRGCGALIAPFFIFWMAWYGLMLASDRHAISFFSFSQVQMGHHRWTSWTDGVLSPDASSLHIFFGTSIGFWFYFLFWQGYFLILPGWWRLDLWRASKRLVVIEFLTSWTGMSLLIFLIYFAMASTTLIFESLLVLGIGYNLTWSTSARGANLLYEALYAVTHSPCCAAPELYSCTFVRMGKGWKEGVWWTWKRESRHLFCHCFSF